LTPEATVKDYLTVQTEGSRRVERRVAHYNTSSSPSFTASSPCAAHSSARADASKLVFRTVRNKMHWAIVGQTAAEIVHARASAARPQMGPTSWSSDQPREGDVSLARNYLNEDEIKALKKRRSESNPALSDYCLR
jgi:hypothetical protein